MNVEMKFGRVGVEILECVFWADLVLVMEDFIPNFWWPRREIEVQPN